MDSESLLSLDEAAKLIPGATAGTLKRLHRSGKLTVYRIGKRFCTTRSDLENCIQACRLIVETQAAPKPPQPESPLPPGLTRNDLARMALDQTIADLKAK